MQTGDTHGRAVIAEGNQPSGRRVSNPGQASTLPLGYGGFSSIVNIANKPNAPASMTMVFV